MLKENTQWEKILPEKQGNFSNNVIYKNARKREVQNPIYMKSGLVKEPNLDNGGKL